MPVDVTPMLAPSVLEGNSLNTPEDLATFNLLPHPDWGKWFARAGAAMPADLRFAGVDYSIFELIANAAVDRLGVGLLSPRLFAPLVRSGHLVAPLATVLEGPHWYFALMREGDARPLPRAFCEWLQRQTAATEASP